ncbi:short-chain dehydrogenase [Kineobactrum sediminis]|uniref:Short-chain dehydrogenase n=1 Tax=Kineobactrum sediminis TaxID=1905677 RepID=A0A2N5XYH8_9GAMM|nr:SDR family oxidoreductase [Kineobactrum sediminis]PLW81201.1 short-chain dehydrogenase [Kineobactrum sediminis]
MKKTVLIIGASGVVGCSAVESFLADPECEIITVSRRQPEVKSNRDFRHISVDLRDSEQAEKAFSSLSGVTHVVYAALYEKPGLIEGWTDPEQMQTNLSMLQNVVRPLVSNSEVFKHITLLQGTKAYGIHLHPMPIPAKENASRDQHDNFYWLQEDYIREASNEFGFDFTILRPQLIIGATTGVAMNLAPVIGAYAAICNELGEPFGFPGGPSYVWEAVDARLLAEVILWAGETPAASGEHFNVTNGDVFEWRNLWPSCASVLGVKVGPDSSKLMSSFFEDHVHTWDAITEKHGLRKTSLMDLLGESHHYADFCFATGADEPPPPAFVSTIKLRQAGFSMVQDTEEMFKYWLEDLIERRILPNLR